MNDYEVNLIDYVKVILKRKKLIFFIFVLAIIAVFVFSLLSPKIYEIDTSLEIGKINKDLIENPEQLIEKIDNDVYNTEYINIDKIAVSNPKGTKLVRMKIESADYQKAKSILEEISNSILKEHLEKIDAQKDLIQKDIEKLENKIKLVDSNIKRTQNKIGPIKSDVKRIENKIIHAGQEQKNLESKINALEEVMVYDQTPGTQFALFDAKEKLENKRKEVENLYLSINSLERTIEDYNIQVNNLEAGKEDLRLRINSLNKFLQEIEPTKIVKRVTISKYPIRPRILLNTAIAAVLGIFLGIFLAFAREWWQVNLK